MYQLARQKLPEKDGRIDFDSFSKTSSNVDHSKIWDFFNYKYFMEINASIATLLNEKRYYVESDQLKDKISAFLEHEAQGNCLHKLWSELKEPSDNIENQGWPKDFEKLVKEDLHFVQEDYRRLSGVSKDTRNQPKK